MQPSLFEHNFGELALGRVPGKTALFHLALRHGRLQDNDARIGADAHVHHIVQATSDVFGHLQQDALVVLVGAGAKHTEAGFAAGCVDVEDFDFVDVNHVSGRTVGTGPCGRVLVQVDVVIDVAVCFVFERSDGGSGENREKISRCEVSWNLTREMERGNLDK